MDRTSDFPWQTSENSDLCQPSDCQEARATTQRKRPYAYVPSNSLERGDVTTIADLAREEGISDRYVSRVARLAWLSSSVLERLVLRREPTGLSIFDLRGVAELPWVEQPGRVFD